MNKGDFMFIDKAEIYVKAGNGGNGIVAFRRKIEPSGGPAGGNGGRGNIIFQVDTGLRTLMDFRYKRNTLPKWSRRRTKQNDWKRRRRFDYKSSSCSISKIKAEEF